MAELLKRNKALSVNPLKSSQAMGAALAFMGVGRATAMLHGAQGCSAFGKIFFVRHFREPVPLQSTAMDQVSTVMGSEDNVIEGLSVICGKSAPDLIGVPSTGVSEAQGSDVRMAIRKFHEQNPHFRNTTVVAVDTPDFSGCLETGYAKAVEALIETLVEGPVSERDASRVNVLVGAHVTPGDIEALKDMVEMFGFVPVVIPDISGSLDGHLGVEDFNPLTDGGVARDDIRSAGAARATLVIGRHLDAAADRLKEICGVADFRFDHLLGLEAVDTFVETLSILSGQAVPLKLERRRAQLQDAMLDSHFMIGQARLAIAGDPDMVKMFADLARSMGAEVPVAVVPTNAKLTAEIHAGVIKIGDLEDLELMGRDAHCEVLIGNSHCARTAQSLGVPLLRAGFPQFDILGGFRRTWMGYEGTRDALFDLGNAMLSVHKGEVEPYISIYEGMESCP